MKSRLTILLYFILILDCQQIIAMDINKEKRPGETGQPSNNPTLSLPTQPLLNAPKHAQNDKSEEEKIEKGAKIEKLKQIMNSLKPEENSKFTLDEGDQIIIYKNSSKTRIKCYYMNLCILEAGSWNNWNWNNYYILEHLQKCINNIKKKPESFIEVMLPTLPNGLGAQPNPTISMPPLINQKQRATEPLHPVKLGESTILNIPMNICMEKKLGKIGQPSNHQNIQNLLNDPENNQCESEIKEANEKDKTELEKLRDVTIKALKSKAFNFSMPIYTFTLDSGDQLEISRDKYESRIFFIYKNLSHYTVPIPLNIDDVSQNPKDYSILLSNMKKLVDKGKTIKKLKNARKEHIVKTIPAPTPMFSNAFTLPLTAVFVGIGMAMIWYYKYKGQNV